MKKTMLAILFMSIIGCEVNSNTRPARNPENFNNFEEQIPKTTVLDFQVTKKERSPAKLPLPTHFPLKQIRPKKLN